MQVKEAMAAAEKAQKLQQNVANRKRNKQLETGGLVIMRALYGNQIVLNNLKSSSGSFESTSDVIDVTIPLNFLVNDSGQLKVMFPFHGASSHKIILVSLRGLTNSCLCKLIHMNANLQ